MLRRRKFRILAFHIPSLGEAVDQRVDFRQGEHGFQRADYRKQRDMAAVVFFLFRAGKDAVLDIVVNHTRGKQALAAGGKRLKLTVHEGDDLIHV